MTKVKICGLTRMEDIIVANDFAPDYIGFILSCGFRRSIDFKTAKALKSKLNPNVTAVGVFVDDDIKKICDLANQGIIDAIQLHGFESDEYVRELKKSTDKTVIKAFEVNCEEDLKVVNNSLADFVLLDSGKGCGKVFDWKLIKSVNRSYFLAGGLSRENVTDAIKELEPYCVDVSSNVETDGVKDREKIAEFIDAVRAQKR
ncbi:MAG: phosphoribosylanthranilate isomerase [Christensenellaceae bacterium]